VFTCSKAEWSCFAGEATAIDCSTTQNRLLSEIHRQETLHFFSHNHGPHEDDTLQAIFHFQQGTGALFKTDIHIFVSTGTLT
jgi:hypothetical protein